MTAYRLAGGAGEPRDAGDGRCVTAERVRPGRVTFAAAAYGLNPVVLFLAVGSGHNDVLVALSIIGAVALLTSRRELCGGGRARRWARS